MTEYYDCRCLICDWMWKTDDAGMWEPCPKCGNDDIYIEESKDIERESCDDCPYRDDNGDCRSPIGCLNEGVTDESEDIE